MPAVEPIQRLERPLTAINRNLELVRKWKAAGMVLMLVGDEHRIDLGRINLGCKQDLLDLGLWKAYVD
ncbi:hypothetical protein D3C84_995500 [compost metagenome]